MRILFIVAARGGSKGVPRKNIAVIGKYPLIAYKLIAAQRCRFEKRIIVSTDDEEIAKVAIKYGGEVPFMRPNNLATDTASSMDVVIHAMNWIEENDDKKYDYVCLLEPSSPFLTFEDIDKALGVLAEKQADTMLSVKEVEVSRNFIFPLDEKGGLSLLYYSVKNMRNLRRQDQTAEYTPNGCIYAGKWNYVKHNKMFHSENSIPYIMSSMQSVEIDSQIDLFLAEKIAESGKINLSMWD